MEQKGVNPCFLALSRHQGEPVRGKRSGVESEHVDNPP